MTDSHVTDQAAEIVAGRREWTADEASHLAGCSDCRTELALLEAVATLGADLTPVVAPEALLPGLHARLAADRRPARRFRLAAAPVGLAAVAVLLLSVVAREPGRDGQPSDSEVALPIPLPELDGMSEQELQLVLEAMDDTLPLTPLTDQWAPDVPGDTELARLLGAEES